MPMDIITVPLFSRGKSPRLLVVGQAPGRTEARDRVPFVGVDGQQLRTWLKSVGITPDVAAFDNVHQQFSGSPTYKPTAKEGKTGYARIAEYLSTHPEISVVLLVGGVAAHMIFKGTMTQMNGRREVRDGVTYIAVYHPGFYRNALVHGSRGAASAAEVEILGVLRQVAGLLAGDESAGVRLPEGRYTDPPPIFSARMGPQGLDVETFGNVKDPREAGFTLAAATPDLIMFDPPKIRRDAIIEVWNVPYDGVVLNTWDCNWDDGKMLAHMMGEEDTTLKGWAFRNLNHLMMSFEEAERQGVLPEYCLDDAQTTHRAIPILKECMDDSVLHLYETLERPLLPLWTKMTIQGAFYLDHDALATYQFELADRVGELLLEVEDALPRGREVKHCGVCGTRSAMKGIRCESGGHHRWVVEWMNDEPVNLNSPVHQLLPALNELGIPVSSTGADILESLADEYPVLKTLLQYRAANKLLSTYITPWNQIEEGERLGCIWNPHGTWTMRVSSRGPNLMNVPADLWRFFHAGEGYSLLRADHGQLEVRIAAHVSGDPAMIEAVRSEDVHGTFQEMLGLDDRRLTKIFVFRSLYCDPDSDDPGTFLDAAAKMGVPMDYKLAMTGLHRMRERFPVYFEWARKASELRVVPGLFGMIHRVPAGDEHHRMLEAINAPIQGGGALVTKFGMLALHRAGYEVVAQVHDEICVRVPDRYLEEARADVPRIMEQAIPAPLLVPLKVELKS